MKILNLIEILENCGMEHLIDDKVVDTLNSIFNILNEYSNKNEIIEQIYWKVTKLILRMMENIKLEFTFNDSSGNHRNLLNKVQCQILVMQNQNDCKEIEDLLSNMENAFNNSCRDEETQEKIDIFKNVICNDMMWKSIVNSKNVIEIMKIISENLLQIILEGNRKNDFIVDYLRILCLSTKIQESEDWNNFLTLKMEATFDKLNASEKMKILIMFMDVLRELYNNQLSNWIKNMLISKLTDVLMVTKEQQIELSIERSVIKMESYLVEASETTLFDILRQRFKISKFLSEITDADEFSQIIESCMENFSKESKKKLRYFPNSFIHRMKLHCLQPIIFCKIISERTKEILLEELFHINNQPNINYLIEIILARHHSQITEILKGNINLDNLKSPAIKSLITIATMQLKFYYYFIQSTESFLHTIEEKLEVFYDFLLPFTMGQNYSVRTYAQTAILTIYDYFKSLSNLHDSNVMRRVEKTCTIINESVILRNYLKHLDILKQDFRFKLEFSQLFTVDTFYHHIPRITNMSEEIIVPDHYDENCELLRKINGMMFKTFDEKTNHKIIKVQDDLEISSANEESLQMTSINLQQKYVPFKYQIPGEKSLLSMPHKFINDNMQLCLKPRSELIVVASLIDKAPNLGGLARTCEVFGVENFVVHSLTIADNNEFKSLSKTAEKWIKMTEIKRWQVLDYILMMKKLGFAIIGAEQSGKSLPLTESQIPSKSLLLLGNEKEGIPANLLSLLDLTIEIPQMGVVRSLNVHVTGALIIWEYTKQHAL
ncbi:CLUMA_CG020374, isoform A [Clunio marinus]|uniref:CLUMA_CG020374, isoform A n=1 Tax=Clunio marinus TaxID=568069 RepID=A0A1J1J8V6_9DIPT|nr:CLUMA_CG020374, isoform A [Clunio marinus]